MKIGLLGFEFSSPNKGCEALSYSFLLVLRRIGVKDVDIYYFSAGEMGLIPDYFPEYRFARIVPSRKDIKCQFIRHLAKCDYVFDVTMGDGFSDIYSLDYYRSLIKQKKTVEFFCKKYILLPQTYGPFNDSKARSDAKQVLSKAFKIYARDEISQSLIKEQFGISNCVLASDMAFMLPYNSIKSEKKRIKIGLNISGLLYKGGFNKQNQFDLRLNYAELMNELIQWILSNERFECHLIPHVIDLSENSYDDDYKLSRCLKDKYHELILPDPFISPIEAKNYISNMDIFIGSRMHSTIAAFSSGVTTIPVSYSRKFEGLFNSLGYKFLISGREETNGEAIMHIIEYINNTSPLIEAQKASMNRINIMNKKFVDDITKDLSLNSRNE